MKKVSFIFLLPFAVFLLPSLVSAQTRLTYPIPDLGYCRDAKECSLYCEIPENKAACWSYGKYKVGSDVLGVTTMNDLTFPIAQLGNCAGPQECRDFCEQPTNQQNCMDFAKKKGFHKETARDELLQKAKTELGCTSMESCSRICESERSRCESFARKHGVYKEPPDSSGRYSAEKKALLMEKARTELGCTSMESCKAACEQNPRVCMAFAQKHGFDKDSSPNYGTERFGKGSCDSEESCKKYCAEHPDECPGFKGYTRATEGGESYMGPSGCRTESECKSWCERHPDTCPGFSEGKAREESTKHEYEIRKKDMENQQEMQKRQFERNREMMQKRTEEYQPPSQNYPTTSTQPAYQTTQPSSDSYAPPETQPAAP